MSFRDQLREASMAHHLVVEKTKPFCQMADPTYTLTREDVSIYFSRLRDCFSGTVARGVAENSLFFRAISPWLFDGEKGLSSDEQNFSKSDGSGGAVDLADLSERYVFLGSRLGAVTIMKQNRLQLEALGVVDFFEIAFPKEEWRSLLESLESLTPADQTSVIGLVNGLFARLVQSTDGERSASH